MAPMSFGWTGKPDRFISNIYEANKRWKYGKLAEDHEFFEKLGSGHAPKYLWIGCADARVPANEIMGEDAGSVFVLRNVANMVVNTDFNLMSGLQYAVSVLKVPHIIVCGHYDCGGVRASMQRKDHGPPLENWLRNIRDVYRLHRNELDSISDPEQRHRRLVELNVIEQCINLFKTGVVQRQRVETFRERSKPNADPKALDYTTPRIHACVFDPKTGDLNRLEVDFREYIEELHTIYDLYTLDDPEVVKDKPHAPKPINEFDHAENGRDPNDVFGGNRDGEIGSREPMNGYRANSGKSSSYRANGDSSSGITDPNDVHRKQLSGNRNRDANDSYRSPSLNGLKSRQQEYRPVGATDGGRSSYDAYNGVMDGPRVSREPYGSISATDGVRFSNDDYDPYRATDGARGQQDVYDAYVEERRDLNEIYRPPSATDGARLYEDEYGPYNPMNDVREMDDHGPYRATEGARPYIEPPPYGATGAAQSTFGPSRNAPRQAAPFGSYLDGLTRPTSNGYPDGSSGGFSY